MRPCAVGISTCRFGELLAYLADALLDARRHSGSVRGYGNHAPPCEAHLTYEISDFDEDICWDRLCYVDVRLSSALVVQYEATVSERSSFIAAASSLTALAQGSIQVFPYKEDVKARLSRWTLAGFALRWSLPIPPPPPAAYVTNPIRGCATFAGGASPLPHSSLSYIHSHAATIQWMYDYHRRWEAHDLYLAEGHVAAVVGVEPRDREVFHARFRYRPEAVNWAPASPVLPPDARQHGPNGGV